MYSGLSSRGPGFESRPEHILSHVKSKRTQHVWSKSGRDSGLVRFEHDGLILGYFFLGIFTTRNLKTPVPELLKR